MSGCGDCTSDSLYICIPLVGPCSPSDCDFLRIAGMCVSPCSPSFYGNPRASEASSGDQVLLDAANYPA